MWSLKNPETPDVCKYNSVWAKDFKITFNIAIFKKCAEKAT